MKKLMNKKGFTLMEMLIVVAIIVILVAISVPTFTANLNEAKVATDEANFRAAKSAAQIYAINNTDLSGNHYYDVNEGIIKPYKETEPDGYGECSKHAKAGETKAAYIKVTYDTDGKPTVVWSNTESCAQ